MIIFNLRWQIIALFFILLNLPAKSQNIIELKYGRIIEEDFVNDLYVKANLSSNVFSGIFGRQLNLFHSKEFHWMIGVKLATINVNGDFYNVNKKSAFTLSTLDYKSIQTGLRFDKELWENKNFIFKGSLHFFSDLVLPSLNFITYENIYVDSSITALTFKIDYEKGYYLRFVPEVKFDIAYKVSENTSLGVGIGVGYYLNPMRIIDFKTFNNMTMITERTVKTNRFVFSLPFTFYF